MAALGQNVDWADFAYTGATVPLEANQLCYSDGTFIRCDSGAASATGLLSDRIVSGTTGIYTYNHTSASIVTAGVERVVVGAIVLSAA